MNLHKISMDLLEIRERLDAIESALQRILRLNRIRLVDVGLGANRAVELGDGIRPEPSSIPDTFVRVRPETEPPRDPLKGRSTIRSPDPDPDRDPLRSRPRFPHPNSDHPDRR